MKTLLVVSSLFLSVPALAATTYDIHCRTQKPIERRGTRPTEFSFTVKITPNSAEFVTTSTDEDNPVKMNPEDSVLDINDNGEIHRTKKGIRLNSDGDGEQYTTIELYEDAGYKAGYAAVKMSGGDDGVYSPVSCSVRER